MSEEEKRAHIDALTFGTFIMAGPVRVDPLDIYKEPEGAGTMSDSNKPPKPNPGPLERDKLKAEVERLRARLGAAEGLLLEARDMIDANFSIFDWKHGGQQLCERITKTLNDASIDKAMKGQER